MMRTGLIEMNILALLLLSQGGLFTAVSEVAFHVCKLRVDRIAELDPKGTKNIESGVGVEFQV